MGVRRVVAVLSALGVSVAATTSGFGAARADAASVAQKRAQAAKLAAQLDDTEDRLSALDEDYNETSVRLAKLRDRLDAARTDQADAERRIRRLEDRARQRALALYVAPAGGILADPAPARPAPGGLPSDLAAQRAQAYLDIATGGDRDVLDALGAAREDLARHRDQVAAATRQADALARQLADKRAAAEALAARQERLLAQTRGDLARLVAEEERRRAEAEARRVRAELARRAEQQRQVRERALVEARAQARAGERPAGTTARPAAPSRRGRAAGLLAPAPSEPPASPAAREAVQVALSQLGKPYRWAGSGPGSFDCSGLMLYAWRAAGRALPHSSRIQYASTTRVSPSAMRPGDLVFFGRPIHHVGMYIGDGQMVHASRRGAPVKISNVFRRDLVGVGRVG